jgi:hypothetical protein
MNIRNKRLTLILATALTAGLTLFGCQKVESEEGETAAKEPSGGFFSFSKPEPITVDAGTPITIRTTTTLSTKSASTGEGFVGSLVEPIVVGDKVISQRGATVRGVVADSDPGGKVKGVARLAVRLTELETADGTVDIVTSTYATQARTTKKKDATKIGIGSGIGAAIGAIAGGGKGAAIGAGAGAGAGTGVVLATRGDPAVIPAESVLTFQLDSPVTVNN